jgi:hypothetical protein
MSLKLLANQIVHAIELYMYMISLEYVSILTDWPVARYLIVNEMYDGSVNLVNFPRGQKQAIF